MPHSRAFFTIEAPALNDYSSFLHDHQSTILLEYSVCVCVHFDQIPLDNRTTR